MDFRHADFHYVHNRIVLGCPAFPQIPPDANTSCPIFQDLQRFTQCWTLSSMLIFSPLSAHVCGIHLVSFCDRRQRIRKSNSLIFSQSITIYVRFFWVFGFSDSFIKLKVMTRYGQQLSSTMPPTPQPVFHLSQSQLNAVIQEAIKTAVTSIPNPPSSPSKVC